MIRLLLQWPYSDWWPVSCFCTVSSVLGLRHCGGGSSLPVRMSERKQLEQMNGETTSLKHLSSLLLHSIKGLSSAYNQSTAVTDDDESLKLSSVRGYFKRKSTLSRGGWEQKQLSTWGEERPCGKKRKHTSFYQGCFAVNALPSGVRLSRAHRRCVHILLSDVLFLAGSLFPLVWK